MSLPSCLSRFPGNHPIGVPGLQAITHGDSFAFWPGGSEGRNFGQVASDVPLVSCNCLIFLPRVDDHTSCDSTSSDVGEGYAGGGEHPSQRQLRGLFEGQSGVHVQREGAIA